MSNTPDQTTQQNKTRLIVGEIGVDTETGIIGKGHSYDNGKTFIVDDTIYGRLYHEEDHGKIWNGIQDKVKTVVRPAIDRANAAVEFANSAIESAKVTSDATLAVSQSIVEAKAAADSAVAEIQQTAQNAASDAAKIRQGVANVQDEVNTANSANASTVATLKSDISSAQQYLATVNDQLAKAQSAAQDTAKQLGDKIATIQNSVDSNRQAINSASGDLAKAQSDAQIAQSAANSSVALISAQVVSNAAAIQSATAANSATAAELNTYTKQAQAQGETIATLQKGQDNITSTIADVQGNVSKVRQTVDGISADLKDTNGAVASVKAQADGLNVTLTTQAKAVASLSATADSLQASLSDADGRLSTVEQTATEHSTTISDIKGDLSQVKQTADGLQQTLKDAQGNISSLQDTAKGQAQTISDVQGNITSLSKTVDGLSATISDHDKSIHTLQATADSLTSDIADAKGNISTLHQTVSGLKSSMTDAQGRLSTVEQTAGEQSTTLSNLSGDVSQVKQTTDGLATTLKDAQGNITSLQDTAKGQLEQIENAQGDIATLQKTADGFQTTLTNHDKAINSLQVTSSGLTDNMKDAQGNISSLQDTAKQLSTTMTSQDGRISKVEQTATEHDSEIADNKGNISSISQKVEGLTGTFANAQKDINAIKVDAQGLHETLTSQGGQIASLNTTVNSLDSKYSGITGDLQSKQTALSTEQQQTNSMLLQKADKSEVDSVNNTVSQVSAEQKIMADQISQSVSSADYQTLKDQVNGIQVGGRNLVAGTDQEYAMGFGIPNTVWKDGFAYAPLPIASSDIEILPQSPHAFYYVMNPGQEYTQTVWFQTDAEVIYLNAANITWFTNNAGHDYQEATIQQVGPNEYKLFSSYKWPGKTDNNLRLFDICCLDSAFDLKTGTYLKFGKLKLEVGNVSTDWTPAPEDFITSIEKNSTAIDETNKAITLKADKTYVDSVNSTAQQLSSKLDVMAGQIKSKVDETKVNNLIDGKGFVTHSTVQSLIDQKADQWDLNITRLQTDVNAIKTTGGGVNLANGTKSDDQSVGNASQTTGWQIATIATFGNPQAGQQYTISVNTKTNGGSWKIQIWDGTSPTQRAKWLCSESTNATQEQKHTVTITWPSGSNKYLLVQLVNNNDGGQISWNSVMLEEGAVAHTWSPAPSDMATVTSVTNLSATVDGIQAQVYNSDGSSRITQLSNVIQSKVGTDDFNALKQRLDVQTLDYADLNTMKTNGHYLVAQPTNSPISGWVYVDVTGGAVNGYERIRQDVYQDNGNQHKYRRWVDNHWMDWEEGATYSEITQLQNDINLRVTKGDLISQINLEAGTTLIQSNQIVLDSDTTVFTGDAFIPNAAISSITADKIQLGSTSLWDSNGTFNLVNVSDGTKSKITTTHGDVYVDGILQNASIIQFSSDMNTNAFTVTPAGATVTPTLFFERYDQTPGHWLGFTRNKIRYEGVEFHTWDDDGERFGVDCHARFNKNVRVLGTFSQGVWDGTPGKPDAGVLYIKGGNTIWSGSNFLAIGDNLSNSYTNVMAKSFSQQSTLSAKTNIQPVDPKDALDLINKTDILSYQYKSDVANGSTKRYTSLIIDDVNDVSQYYAPNEFVNEDRTGRDDGSTVGYLVLAVKELTNRIKALESNAK